MQLSDTIRAILRISSSGFERKLAQGFVDCDAHGSREVQAAHVAVRIGILKECSRFSRTSSSGKPLDSGPNTRQSPAPVFHVGVETLCAGAEKKERDPGKHDLILPGRLPAVIHIRPVIEPGAANGTLIDSEPEVSHKMQRQPVRSTEPRDVSGIGMNLRFV